MAQHVGKYRLGDKLGVGTYGEVWAASCCYTGKSVAIKIARLDNIDTLLYEAKVMKHLKGTRGVASLLGCGKLDDGRHYLVTEMLGSSLAQVKGRVTERQAKWIGRAMLRTISAIHEKGMLHRDIKPDNFLLGKGEGPSELCLIDYGFCKLYQDRDGNLLPASGGAAPVGSPAYMSGDVQMGRDAGRKDDLESMCYALLALLEGSVPWYRLLSKPGPSNDEVGSAKKGLSPYELVGKALWLGAMLKYVKLLSRESVPNYSLLEELLT